MGKVTNEMTMVSKCDVKNCGYNVDNNCHAKAITVGDETNPACDTFFENLTHNHETKRIAGVGACKVSDCQFNKDFECGADNVTVGFGNGNIHCLTFQARL